jgi:hypothetical protein
MDKIASALVKAQKGFAPALKSNTNPHFKSKYADLAACVEAVIDSLNENGIALIQKQHPSEGGVSVETVFVHESGETLSAGILSVPASKQDPQGYGSALTYARRYSLMAACGIAPEDDDGNAAKPGPNRTKVMKITNSIKDHLANDRELGALQEWEIAREDDDMARSVWAGLSTPERDKLRQLSKQAA